MDNIGSNSQMRQLKRMKYFYKKYFFFLQVSNRFKNVSFSLIWAFLRACKILASACTFGPKWQKGHQINGRYDVTSRADQKSVVALPRDSVSKI